jgi:dolichyl-phosphate-mannose-protein mannosyltransferase
VPRIANLTRASLWADELNSVAETSGRVRPLPINTVIPHAPNWSDLSQARPWPHVWTNLELDEELPLYFLLLRGWRELFGPGDTVVRSLSVVASLASVALFYRAIRLTSGTHVALAVALILAVSEPQVRYAHEARDYALLGALSGAAAVALLEIRRGGWLLPRFVFLTLAATAVLFTHILGGLVLLAMAIWSAIVLTKTQRLVALGALALAMIIFLAALGPHTLAHMRNTHDVTLYRQQSPSLNTDFRRFLATPGFLLIDLPLRPRQADPLNWTPLAINLRMALGLFVFFVAPWFIRRRPDLLFWWLWMVLVLGAFLGADLVLKTPLLLWLRMYLFAAPAVIAVLAIVGAATLSRPTAITATILLAAACASALPYTDGLEKTDWRGAGQLVASRMTPGEPFIARTPGDVDPGLFWSYLAHYLPTGDRPLLLLQDQDPTAELMSRLIGPAGGRAWVLTWPDMPPPQGWLPGIRQPFSKGIGTWGDLYEIEYKPTAATQR